MWCRFNHHFSELDFFETVRNFCDFNNIKSINRQSLADFKDYKDNFLFFTVFLLQAAPLYLDSPSFNRRIPRNSFPKNVFSDFLSLLSRGLERKKGKATC